MNQAEQRYPCPYCQRDMGTPSYLKRHILLQHSDHEITGLAFMLNGNHDMVRSTIRHMTKEELQKLSDALDYYAVLVDEQLIRGAHQEQT